MPSAAPFRSLITIAGCGVHEDHGKVEGRGQNESEAGGGARNTIEGARWLSVSLSTCLSPKLYRFC